MTTIAYKDGVLAADTRVTQDDTILPNATKIVRRFSRSVAFCGSLKTPQDFEVHTTFSRLRGDWEAITTDGELVDSDGSLLRI